MIIVTDWSPVMSSPLSLGLLTLGASAALLVAAAQLGRIAGRLEGRTAGYEAGRAAGKAEAADSCEQLHTVLYQRGKLNGLTARVCDHEHTIERLVAQNPA